MISCHEIWKVYNKGKPYEVIALQDISLLVEDGSFVAIQGPSGSGKTSLLSILGAIDRPSNGKVFINDIEITSLSEEGLTNIRRRIGFVFQQFNLIPRLRAWENVAIPLIPLGVDEKTRKKKAFQLLEMVGLHERVFHRPEEMSGGEQQRIAIARALIKDPLILILDEPTSNIDIETAETILFILKEMRSKGKTIIISTHDEKVTGIADKVFMLKKGRVTG